ncbi:MAG TPA: hypothetical protein VK168_20375 [Saprospiraceae bacterium]|nr:hypothetical protein [Saprospiraceae bacterium]
MASRFKISLVWLWALALVSSTAGVSIHQVYCYCVGETTVSLFEAEDACHMQEMMANVAECCKKPAPQAPKSCCEKPAQKDDGCTKKTTRVVKLKADYEVSNTGLKKLDSTKWCFLPVFQAFEPALQPVARPLEISRFDRPPPPLSGRMICVRHGVFRC